MSKTQKYSLAPIPPADWNDNIVNALSSFPGGLKYVSSHWQETGEIARGAYVLGTLAHHTDLAKAFLTFNNHVATNSTLSARERELLILRIGWLRKCEYEYIQHVILGKRAGLLDDEIARTQIGPDADDWTGQDATLMRVADELNADARIGDSNMAELSKHYSAQQIMDMIFLIGCYESVAMAIKSFNIPLEPGSPTLDDETRRKMFSQ
ncbi:carboxymuconolactone decarboxylase family protein [Zhongshania sp.]|uniref:carboxymuconolactone decarboxylase family protein n=1 Tax=Zhongshania sp. TaxID=1971902 RepID=UPI003568D911